MLSESDGRAIHDPARRPADHAGRDRPPGRRLPPERPRSLRRAPRADSVRQGRLARMSGGRPALLRLARLRRGGPGRPRALRLGGALHPLPRRRLGPDPGRLRHGGMDRRPALVRRQRRHHRRLLRGRHAVPPRADPAPAPPRHVRAGVVGRLLGRVGLPRGRLRAGVHARVDGQVDLQQPGPPGGGPRGARAAEGHPGAGPRRAAELAPAAPAPSQPPGRGPRRLVQRLPGPSRGRPVLVAVEHRAPPRRRRRAHRPPGRVVRHLPGGHAEELRRPAGAGADPGGAGRPAADRGAVGARALEHGQDGPGGGRLRLRGALGVQRPAASLVRPLAPRRAQHGRRGAAGPPLRHGREPLARRPTTTRWPASARPRGTSATAGRSPSSRRRAPSGPTAIAPIRTTRCRPWAAPR